MNSPPAACRLPSSSPMAITNARPAVCARDFRFPLTRIGTHCPDSASAWITLWKTAKRFADEFTVVELPGASPGEIALHGADMLHVGDALVHLPPLGLSILPDKYCSDPKELRRSLEKLLSFRFEALTFAHGQPVMTQARQRLSHLIA